MTPSIRGALVQPMSLPKPRAHVIAAVDYSACGIDYDAAPMDCTCGWSGRAGDYADHRRASGQLTQRRANGSRVLSS